MSHSISQRGIVHSGKQSIDRIDIHLPKVPDNFRRILLLSCMYEAKKRGLSFADAENLRLHLINQDTGEELCTYSVCSENSEAHSILFGSLYSEKNGWIFEFDGKEDDEELIGVIATRYGMRVDWRSDYKNFDPNKGIFS